MHIVVFTNLFPNPAEPLRSTFNEKQIKHLYNLTDLCVISPIDWVRKIRFWRCGQLKKIRQCNAWDSIPVYYPTYFHLPKLPAVLFGPLMFLSVTFRWIRIPKDRKHLTFATWAYPDGFAAVLLSKLSRIPVVIKVHGSDVENINNSKLLRLATFWTLNQCDKVIAVSQFLKTTLVNNGVEEDKIEVIRNGVEKSLFQCSIHAKNKEFFTLLYVGNFKEDKGIFVLLESLKLIQNEGFRGIRLTMVGDGPDFNRFKEMASDMGLISMINLVGRVPSDRVAMKMRESDILVLPSYHEGLPNVIIEALHTGIPVVATSVGGIPEIIDRDNGLLVNPKDPRDLAHGIKTATEKVWEHEKIIDSAEIFTSWEKNAMELLNLFRSLIQGVR